MLKKNLSSKSNLRVEGVPEEVILKDEEHMKEINEKLEKLKSGSCTKSSRKDLKKETGDIISVKNQGA